MASITAVNSLLPQQREGEKILINVSGRRFEVSCNVLEQYPDTLLGSTKREFFYEKQSNEYFFNRDPEIFRYILNYYNTGKLHYPRNECLLSYDEELSFFGILSNAIDDCCCKDYHDRKQENMKILLNNEESKNCDSNQPQVTNIRQKMWRAFENPYSSTLAFLFFFVAGFFIVVSIITIIAETAPCGLRPGRAGTLSCAERYKIVFFLVNMTCVIIFTMEYLLLLFAAPNRSKFVRRTMSVIHIIVIMSYYFELLLPDTVYTTGMFVIFRVFRILRIFKFSQHSQGLHIFGKTLKLCASELSFLIFLLSIFITIFATASYYAEKNVDGTNFTSVPGAIWYVVVTMTSLGYGDMIPETINGKIIGGICSLVGLLFIAFFISVITSSFNQIYNQNQQVIQQKAQRKLGLLKQEQAENESENFSNKDHRLLRVT